MESVVHNISDRQLKFSRLLNAPVELVWDVWTSPAHMKFWWGPNGVTSTIKKMDVKSGGEFRILMHNPNGVEHELEIEFREIVKYQRIVYKQLNHFKCVATIDFESRANKTFLHWAMLFESKETLIEYAKIYGIVSGLQQTGERLTTYLSQFKNQ